MPSQGPFVDVLVVDPATLPDGGMMLRWGESGGPAISIRVLHGSFNEPVLVIKNEGSEGNIVLQGGGKEYSFKTDVSGLAISAGNEGGSLTPVLKLPFTPPPLTGVVPASPLKDLIAILDTALIVDDQTT